jgi:hypothetical protein
MAFNFNLVLGDMANAIKENSADASGNISTYAKMVMEKEKISLQELAIARLDGDISEQEFNDEVAREKKVLQAELLTLKIMGKAMAQKAVNAAMGVFINAIKVAI